MYACMHACVYKVYRFLSLTSTRESKVLGTQYPVRRTVLVLSAVTFVGKDTSTVQVGD